MIFCRGNKARILSDSDMEDELLVRTLTLLKKYPDEIFQFPQMVGEIAAARIDSVSEDDYVVHEIVEGEDVIKNAIEHNMNGLKGKSTLLRPTLLTMPMRSISYIQRRMKHMKVLTIGPRTEAEIFMLTACGFDPINITAIDLMSYSPLIEVGDMHDMPYEDETFDIVIIGWVLAYSENPIKAVREARRVAKKKGIFAVGCEYTPYTPEELINRGSIVSHGGKYRKVDDILDLFEGDVGEVWFKNEIHPDDVEERDSVLTIFQRKIDT